MTHACEAVKPAISEISAIFPVLALVVLFLWGSSQSLPVCGYWHQYPALIGI